MRAPCPRRDGGFLQLTFILYLTDVRTGHGPTCAVAHPDVPAGAPPLLHDREQQADVYAAERPVAAQAGDLLVYETSTFHRGSRMVVPDAERVSVHFQYAAASHRWLGKLAFGIRGGSPEMTRFLVTASPAQRTLVGFPAVGSDYWNPQTLRAVASRYPEMDLTPYRALVPA